MKIVELRRLNLIYKISIAAAIIVFALLFKSVWYNLVVILILTAVLKSQRIRIIRFHSLSYGLLIFLSILFIFRAFTGYGKIIFSISEQIRLTSGGLTEALLTVEQLVLIFLVMGVALYSATRTELYYYFSKIPGGPKGEGSAAVRLGRMSLFVVYLLPEMFRRGSLARRQLQNAPREKRGVRGRLIEIAGVIGDFVVELLRRAEELYPEFAERNSSAKFTPIPVLNVRHISLAGFLVLAHLALLWMTMYGRA